MCGILHSVSRRSPLFFMTLLGLALLDSLSTGTLVIPLIFLAQSQLRARTLILYCFTLGLFYVVLGFLLLLGVETITWTHHPVFSSQERYWIKLVLGVLLFAYGILSPDPNSRASETKWRTRLEKVADPRTTIFIALLAGVLEAATMLPYLAAISMINTWESTIIGKLIVLVSYCIIMFIPTLTLLVIRSFSVSWLTPKLDRLVSLATRNADGAILWIAAIIGFLMAQRALTEIL